MTPTHPYRDDEWWRDHYSGALLDLWQAIVPPGQAGEDADFLIRHCNLSPGERALDIPCGQGRVAIALAERGFEATGIDISEGQVRLAREAAEARGLPAAFEVGDMRVPPPGPFELAFCWGDSFGYMDDGGNADFLRAVRGVLRPGGCFALEMQMIAELLETRFVARSEGGAGDFDICIERDWDRAAGRMSVAYALSRGGKKEVSRASFRIHTVDELKSLLADAGFAIEALLDRTGGPFSPASDCLRAVCRAS